MTGKMKIFTLYRVLANGQRYQHIDFVCFQIIDSTVKRTESGFARNFSGHSHINLHLFFYAINEVYFPVLTLFGIFDKIEWQRFTIEHLSVIRSCFCRSINNRRKNLQQPIIGKCFKYYFISNTIQITVRNTYFNSFRHLFIQIIFLSSLN